MGQETGRSDSNNASRIKRRRTRSERNNLRRGRSAPPKKHPSLDLRASHPPDCTLTGFSWVAQIRDAIEPLPTDKPKGTRKVAPVKQTRQPQFFPSTITTNRLTKTLGIFNQGKKSRRINRGDDPLSKMPAVKAQGDKDTYCGSIEEDLQIGDGGPLPIVLNSGSSSASMDEGDRNRIANPLSCKSSYSFPRTPDEDCKMDVQSHARQKRLENMTDSLPQSPDFENIARRIASVMKPREIYPGHRYLQETKEELYRLLQQNAVLAPSPTEDLQLRLQVSPEGTAAEESPEQSVHVTAHDKGRDESVGESVATLSNATKAGTKSPNAAVEQQTMDIIDAAEGSNPVPTSEQEEANYTNPAGRDGPASDEAVDRLAMDAKLLLECNDKALARRDHLVTTAGGDGPGMVVADVAVRDFITKCHPSTICADETVCTGRGGAGDTGHPADYMSGATHPYFLRSSSHPSRSCSCMQCGPSVLSDHNYLGITHPGQSNRLPQGDTLDPCAPVITQYNYPGLHLPGDYSHTFHYPQENEVSLDLLDMLDCDPERRGLLDPISVTHHPSDSAGASSAHYPLPCDPCSDSVGYLDASHPITGFFPNLLPRPPLPIGPLLPRSASPPKLYPQRLF